jgi:hypothetical protein
MSHAHRFAFLVATALLAVFLTCPAFATTVANRDILIDGDSSDFAEDETLLGAGEELNFDSRWGENNDVNQIKLSWDLENLYVAVDGRCWGNNIILFLDTDPLGGIPDQGKVNAWNRKFFFFGHRPDFFLATWDTNTEPQFWRVQPGATQTVEQVNQSSFDASASFSQGRPDASMEAALPWTLIYPELELGSVPEDAEIAVVAAVVTSSDFNSGPDAAPNSSQPMPENEGDYAFIDNFAILRIDRDADGLPDLEVAPNLREGDAISHTPPMSLRLDPTQAGVDRAFTILEAEPKAISPNGDGRADAVDFRVALNGDGILNVDIYDALGRRIRRLLIERALSDGMEITPSWDGKDSDGRPVDAGVYIARVEILFNERRNIPLAVLR